MSEHGIAGGPPEHEIKFPDPPEHVLQIFAEDGRPLLAIKSDGNWEVSAQEDAKEAADLFAQTLAEGLAQLGFVPRGGSASGS